MALAMELPRESFDILVSRPMFSICVLLRSDCSMKLNKSCAGRHIPRGGRSGAKRMTPARCAFLCLNPTLHVLFDSIFLLPNRQSQMKYSNVRSALCIAAALLVSYSAPSWSQPANELLRSVNADCTAEYLGKVTRVAVIDAKQANAIYKKGRAPQIAKQGEVYVQVFIRSKDNPNYFYMEQVDRVPTASEIAELVGRPSCTISAD